MSNAVPPYESNGRGAPTTGNTPVTIAIFTNTYKKMIIANPLATRLLNLFFALRPIPVIEIIIRKYIKIIALFPINPNSSPMSVKTKSVCFSGR